MQLSYPYNIPDINIYFLKVHELQNHLASERGKASSSTSSLAEARNRIETLVTKISELEGANLKLNQKISDLAQDIEDQNSNHKAQVTHFLFIFEALYSV